MPTRMQWRVFGADPKQDGLRRQGYLCRVLVDAVARACQDLRLSFPPLPDSSHSFYHRRSCRPRRTTSVAVAGHQAWQALVQRDARVPRFGMSGAFPSTLQTVGERFADLDDPFEPLHRIEDAGYVLEVVTDSDVLLVAQR
jgi:hypothetical protein